MQMGYHTVLSKHLSGSRCGKLYFIICGRLSFILQLIALGIEVLALKVLRILLSARLCCLQPVISINANIYIVILGNAGCRRRPESLYSITSSLNVVSGVIVTPLASDLLMHDEPPGNNFRNWRSRIAQSADTTAYIFHLLHTFKMMSNNILHQRGAPIASSPVDWRVTGRSQQQVRDMRAALCAECGGMNRACP